MLTDVESAILRLTQLIDLFGDLSVNSNYAEVLLTRKDEKALKTAIEALKERPHGEWIKKYNADDPTTACSVCGFDTEDKVYLNFCPNCGVDMRKEGGEK